MDDLWQQFHRLPKTIRDAVATPAALAAVERIEQKYPGLDLANFVMRAMIKEFPIGELPQKLQAEAGLKVDESQQVSQLLKTDVFSKVADYVGLTAQPTTPTVSASKSAIAPAPRPVRPPANLPMTAVPAPNFSAGPPPLVTSGSAGQSISQPLPPKLVVPVPSPWPQPVMPTSPPVMPRPIVQPVVVATAPASSVRGLPPPLVTAVPTSPIGSVAPTQEYSEEEANEIAKQTAHLKNLSQGGLPSDFDDIAQRILESHHLAWPDELLTKRALALSKARLKDIRNSALTTEMMTREPKVGGLGLDLELAKQLVTDLEKEASGLKERGMVRPPTPVAPPPPIAVPPVSRAQPLGQPPLTRFVPPSGLPPNPATPSMTEAPRPSRPIKRPADIPQPITPPLVALKEQASSPTTLNQPLVMQRPRQTDRPAMADITRTSKTLGPAEEMKSMTLTEWRRLGQGASESARNLLEKFRHLQRESFSLWAEAVAGWRQSEVYLLYIDMGRQSLNQSLTIQEVIAARAGAGQAYLSEHEFTIIADLNRQLQF